MKVIGLTGGVACGKSSVAQLLEQRGFVILDTDVIAHELLNGDAQTRAEVMRHFGTLERPKLRQRVFDNPSDRKALENILHPRIRTLTRARLDAIRQTTADAKGIVVVVPLLFESGFERLVDITVSVVSTRENQLKRLAKRDGTSRDLAEKMIDAQLPNETKAERSTHVIRNDGTLQDLELAVDNLVACLL